MSARRRTSTGTVALNRPRESVVAKVPIPFRAILR